MCSFARWAFRARFQLRSWLRFACAVDGRDLKADRTVADRAEAKLVRVLGDVILQLRRRLYPGVMKTRGQQLALES
jgi:hypothetical protein